MNTGGFIFLIVSWAMILLLVVSCFITIFSKKELK